MKVIAINSSPNAQHGCTAKMLEHILAGMQAAGATTETFHLGKLKINPCLGCLNCWTKTPGKCVHNDDMENILQKYLTADFVILATPLYVFNVSGMMKNYLDRNIPLAMPFMESSKSKVTGHPSRYQTTKKKILLVSPCGFPEFEHFAPLVSYIKFLANKTEFEWEYVGEILRPAAGMIFNHPKFQDKFVTYCADLNVAGKQLITDGKIAPELNTKLQQLLIQPEEFRKLANEYFAGVINKIAK